MYLHRVPRRAIAARHGSYPPDSENGPMRRSRQRRNTHRHRYLRARAGLRQAIADTFAGRVLTAEPMWGER